MRVVVGGWMIYLRSLCDLRGSFTLGLGFGVFWRWVVRFRGLGMRRMGREG